MGSEMCIRDRFLGDNGSDGPLGNQHAVACAAPLRGKKGAHYEGGMRVPFIASWAKRNDSNSHQKRLPIPAGKVHGQLAAVQDIFPTITNFVGIERPADHVVDGVDMSTLLKGQRDADRKDEFLMHYPHSPHRSNYFTSYRRDDWKVVYHYFPGKDSDGQRYQLFNLKDDPFEQTDLAKSRPPELKQMMTELAAQLVAHDAVYPIEKTTEQPVKPIVPN